ncbi:FAD-dependent monooxygenase [Amycolatopsis thermoflava]|uniref:FAD-dependent monooxygenase n=1 Tax=Amycolatopsis thermoflava TaxID=84480 RepID=UPI003D719CAA
MRTKRGAAGDRIRRERQGNAVVVGASCAGLMASLALSRAGIDVTLLEKATVFPHAGGAIGGVSEPLLERITGRKRTVRDTTTDTDGQPWFAVYTRLRSAVDDEPHITFRHARVTSVGQDADRAWATTTDGNTYTGDVVIGADGHRSVVRRAVAPDKPDATFAGYVIWLGLADESAIASRHRWPHDTDILYRRNDCLLGYPLPSREGSLTPGTRRIGFAWYDASRNDLMRELGCVRDTVAHHTLAAADVPATTLRELAVEVDGLWPALWRDVIHHCLDQRTVIGAPIAEYLPDHLVNGRLALVGDAGHVPTPMTGSGFGMALQDAEVLAEAVADGLDGRDMALALQRYEHARLDSVRATVHSGQRFSRSFAGRAG